MNKETRKAGKEVSPLFRSFPDFLASLSFLLPSSVRAWRPSPQTVPVPWREGQQATSACLTFGERTVGVVLLVSPNGTSRRIALPVPVLGTAHSVAPPISLK